MSSSTPSLPTPLDGIMKIAPYVPGESKLVSDKPILQLAANEGALGPSPKAIEAIRNMSDDLHRYPDGMAKTLKEKLSEKFKAPADQLMIGAGSDELISLLIKAYAGQGDEVLYSEHGFLMYPLSALSSGATPVKAPETNLKTSVQAILGHVTERTKLVFIANPNNPTGSYLTSEELQALHKGLPSNVILVIDGAYTEFATAPDYSDGHDLVAANQNVVVLRTFSKIFGLASLRVGWGYAPKHICEVIERVRGPFNVSAAAQVAAVAALEDEEHYKASQNLVQEVLPWFRKTVQALGLDVPPSLGNFVMVKFGADRIAKAEAHLKSEGIIGRRIDAYGLGDFMRISIGKKDEMQRVVDAIEGFLKS